MIRAQLRSTGENTASGKLEGHPCEHTEVRTCRIGADLAVSLWELGKHRVGEGLLRRQGDRYVGTCSEYRGLWHVTGIANTGQLVFSESADDAYDRPLVEALQEPSND